MATVVVTAPLGTNPGSTRRPTVTWTWTDAGAQAQYRVKVFSSAQYSVGGFDPDTSPNTWDSGAVFSSAVSRSIPVSLGDATYKAYVKAANGTPTFSAWAAGQFAITAPPLTPTNVTPVNGGSVNTNVPTLGATIAAGAIAWPAGVKATWAIAKDAGFATGLRSVEPPASKLQASGTFSYVLPDEFELAPGQWFMRAFTKDEFGTLSPPSAITSFVVAHLPSAGNLFPSSDESRVYGDGTVTFSWIFSDTSPGNTQSAFQVIVERNDTGVLVLDSGKVSAGQAAYAVGLSAALKDLPLRWKVRLWDAYDQAGPYATPALFRVRDVPTVTITSPTDSGSIDRPQPTITWTFSASGGRTQQYYRVQVLRTSDSQVVADSGNRLGAQTNYTLATAAVHNAVVYTVRVILTDSVGMGNSQTITATGSWTPPTAPSFSVDASTHLTNGYVTVSWTNAAVDPAFSAWRVYRRPSGSGSYALLKEYTNNVSSYVYKDWSTGGTLTYDYAVVQVALRFGAVIESAYNATTVTPDGNEYWLIYPADEFYNTRLHLVTADSFTDEYEQQVMNLIGRGRHVDYGQHLGATGTLTAKLRGQGSDNARVQRQKLQTLKGFLAELQLRTPFGDVMNVAIGDIQIGRVAGVGPNEYCDISIPYFEIG